MGEGQASVVDTTLRPKLLRIGRRRYRTAWPDDAAPLHGYDEDGDASGIRGQAVEQADGQLRLSIPVPSAFYGKLVGRQGRTRAQLERDTAVRIQIPGPKSKEEQVVLLGPSVAALESCRTRIELLLEEARAKAPPTHFVSIPLLDPSCARACHDFAQAAQALDVALDPRWVSEPESLHLTLCVLKLYTQEEVLRAVEVLKQAKERAQELLQAAGTPLIRLQGLNIMNDDPSAVDVLYVGAACTSHPALLQQVADQVAACFATAGLAPSERVKLHCTLVNTRRSMGHDKRRDAESPPQQRQHFNAQLLLERFGNFDFGACPLNALHLSRMARTAKGYYEAEATVALGAASKAGPTRR